MKTLVDDNLAQLSTKQNTTKQNYTHKQAQLKDNKPQLSTKKHKKKHNKAQHITTKHNKTQLHLVLNEGNGIFLLYDTPTPRKVIGYPLNCLVTQGCGLRTILRSPKIPNHEILGVQHSRIIHEKSEFFQSLKVKR